MTNPSDYLQCLRCSGMIWSLGHWGSLFTVPQLVPGRVSAARSAFDGLSMDETINNKPSNQVAFSSNFFLLSDERLDAGKQ